MSDSTPFDDLRNRLPAEWLRERDIDMLICSELHSGEGPLHRLLLGGWNGGNAWFGGAWVPYAEPDGETDIAVLFESDSGRLALLIEKQDRRRVPAGATRAIPGAGRTVESLGWGWAGG